MIELEQLVDALPLPAYFFDVESLMILVANQAFARLLGYAKEELHGMTVADLRSDDELPKLRRALQSAPPEDSVEWKYQTKSGSPLFVQITYRNSKYFHPNGDIFAVRMVVISKAETTLVRSSDQVFGGIGLPTLE